MASIGEEQTAAAAATTAPGEAGAAAGASATGAGASEYAAGPPPAATAMMLTPDVMLRMRAYRNLRYHEDRQSHYERLQRWSNYATVVLGSAGLTSLLASAPFLTVGAALGTTLVGAGQLVFDFSTRARQEADLKRECANILAAADEPEFDPNRGEADLSKMYGTELETYHAVNALAYNAAQLAFGRPKSTLLKVTSLQKWLRHIRTFEPSDFPDQQAAGA